MRVCSYAGISSNARVLMKCLPCSTHLFISFRPPNQNIFKWRCRNENTQKMRTQIRPGDRAFHLKIFLNSKILRETANSFLTKITILHFFAEIPGKALFPIAKSKQIKLMFSLNKTFRKRAHLDSSKLRENETWQTEKERHILLLKDN